MRYVMVTLAIFAKPLNSNIFLHILESSTCYPGFFFLISNINDTVCSLRSASADVNHGHTTQKRSYMPTRSCLAPDAEVDQHMTWDTSRRAQDGVPNGQPVMFDRGRTTDLWSSYGVDQSSSMESPSLCFAPLCHAGKNRYGIRLA